MASFTAPSTPSHQPILHRSFTLPAKLIDTTKLQTQHRTPSPGAVETLFAHHAGRIVSFSPPLDLSAPRSRSTSLAGLAVDAEPIGTLPYVSHTERTIAAGSLRIDRVPGSVAFLNSGKLVHPILAKSQCWCVDGETQFVLRIRKNNFYRIELPNDCIEDQQVADELKTVFAKVAQYETTPCPFKRAFHIELPESPQTPKKPWTPKHGPLSPIAAPKRVNCVTETGTRSTKSRDPTMTAFPAEDERPNEERNEKTITKSNNSPLGTKAITLPMSRNDLTKNTTPSGTANSIVASLAPKSEKIMPSHSSDLLTQVEPTALGYLERQGYTMGKLSGSEHSPSARGTRTQSETLESILSLASTKASPRPEQVDVSNFKWLDDSDDFETPTKSRSLHEQITPSLAQLKETSYSDTPTAPTQRIRDPETISIASSVDSFHSFHSPISPMSPSPPFSLSSNSSPSRELKLSVTRIRPHKRDTSNLTITAESPVTSDDMPTPLWLEDSPTTSMKQDAPFRSAESLNLDSDEPSELAETRPSLPSNAVRRRLGRRRRTQSPLPSPANLYAPQSRLSGHHLTSAILQKTCSMLLGPPVHLVAMMLSIAARIANGAFKGGSFTYGEDGQPIPCSWDSSSEDEVEETHDDVGISLEKRELNEPRRRIQDSELGGSWEVD